MPNLNVNNEKSELANGQLYVDLGLPSGLKWAKCNIGAETETDYGYYFQWGETELHDNGIPYVWENYKHCNRSSMTLTKYNNSDGKTTLDLEDDAAAQIMGGNWRMPTKGDFQELLDNTTNESVTNFNSSGVSGRKFTSKTDESKYIFIPASGVRFGSLLGYQGYDGYIWSSSLNASNPNNAWYLGFFWDYCGMGCYGRRCEGQTVRGVMD